MPFLDEVLEQKKNIFDHIFYEMEMFLYTEILLTNIDTIDLSYDSCIISKKEERKQVLINILIVSNFTHIRNLLYFFSPVGKQDDIICSNILKNPYCAELNFDNKSYDYIEAKEHVNKTVSHLTEVRLLPKSTIESYNILKPIKLALLEKIRVFISLSPQAVKEEYMAQYNTSQTLELMQIIKNLLNKNNYSYTS